MNFTPFGNPFTTTLPSMHQFATKFSNDQVLVNSTGVLTGHNAMVVTSVAGDGSGGGIQYLRAEPIAPTTSSIVNTSQLQATAMTRIANLPSNIQVMNSVNTGAMGAKYPGGTIIGWENVPVPVHHFATVDPKMVSVPYTQQATMQTSSPPSVWPVRLINATTMTSDAGTYQQEAEPQDLCKVNKEDRDHKQEKQDEKVELIQIPIQSADGKLLAWPDNVTAGSAVADYLSRLPANTLPISLHHFLKYSTEAAKKDGVLPQEVTLSISDQSMSQEQLQQVVLTSPTQGKKKKKKKTSKEKKPPRPRPGEIRLSTALDGSTLFCCPECHMAYPERFSLEQHLAGHKLERRFVCDVCGAGLKRKEHLDQHKRGHSQERPFVCSICMKGFKRNEHLTRHYVIHSGDKNHVCGECGKAFSRKDHLHKHSQTHIAKRVKAELSQHGMSAPVLLTPTSMVSS